jgi:hypothetical protein
MQQQLVGWQVRRRGERSVEQFVVDLDMGCPADIGLDGPVRPRWPPSSLPGRQMRTDDRIFVTPRWKEMDSNFKFRAK